MGDGSDPTYRPIIAAGLARVIEILTPIRDELPGLRPFFQLEDERYPAPHNKIFEFEATSRGAEWIDAIADRARAPTRGPMVVGHMDWRIEHLRFAAGKIVASYDWDSVQCRGARGHVRHGGLHDCLWGTLSALAATRPVPERLGERHMAWASGDRVRAAIGRRPRWPGVRSRLILASPWYRLRTRVVRMASPGAWSTGTSHRGID